MLDFRQSTAATVVVGPILDSTGAEYTSAVIGDLSISKNGGTLTAMAAAATLTHIANGQYTLVMTTGNLDTLGRFQITCNKSTYQMPERSGMVMPASVWDALYANATNATGGLPTATGAIAAFAGAISTFAGGAVASVTGDVGGNVTGSVGSVVGAVVLDPATQTQLNNIENTAAQRSFGIIERPPSDTGVITFAWPSLGATITGTVSLNNASYIPVTGAFEFLRTDGGRYFYTLAYNAADRPVSAGSARYALTDGTYTRYIVLRVVESGDTGETTALAVLCFDWEAITGEVPSRSVLNALRHIRNKWALDGNTKTVYAEDDTTPAYTTTVIADGAGNITADTPD